MENEERLWRQEAEQKAEQMFWGNFSFILLEILWKLSRAGDDK